jgi:hypothetical protein
MQLAHDQDKGCSPVLGLAEIVETLKLEKGIAGSENFVDVVFDFEKFFFKGG